MNGRMSEFMGMTIVVAAWLGSSFAKGEDVSVAVFMDAPGLEVLAAAKGYEAESHIAARLSAKRNELQAFRDRVKTGMATAEERKTILAYRRATTNQLVERMELLIESVECGDWNPGFGTLNAEIGSVGYWPGRTVRVVSVRPDYFVVHDERLRKFEFYGFSTARMRAGDRRNVSEVFVITQIRKVGSEQYFVVESVDDPHSAFENLIELANGNIKAKVEELKQYVDEARRAAKPLSKVAELQLDTRKVLRRLALTESLLGRNEAGAQQRAWMEEIVNDSSRSLGERKRAANLLEFMSIKNY